MEKKIRVLIVDDSDMVRKIFSRELAKDPLIEVVGAAPDAFIARDKIVESKPDILLLDIEMPKMDGLTFLERLNAYYPIPTIIVSSLAKEGGAIALRAHELGAAEVIEKPGPAYSVKEMCEQLVEKIKAVSQMKKIPPMGPHTAVAPQEKGSKPSNKIIAIGASTGGVEALTDILPRLPAGMPPILIVQHMAGYFLEAFAERLNGLCSLEVKVAEDQESLAPGKAYFAPGNKHLLLKKTGNEYKAIVKEGPLVLHQRPSAEVLFQSMAMYAGADAIGVILSGMGKDGAKGLLEMRNTGAFTVAQNEASSIVFGMPKEAIQAGAVSKVASLEEIPQILVDNL